MTASPSGFERRKQREKKARDDLKKVIFAECVKEFGGKDEIQFFQSFQAVQQSYIDSKPAANNMFEKEILQQIKEIGRVKARIEQKDPKTLFGDKESD